MKFQTPLVRGTLVKRYKRFLADVTLEDGREVTAHCANPGSMLGLQEPNSTVWLEPNDDPKKKLKFSWKLIQTHSGLVCVDTGLANKVVKEGLSEGAMSPFEAYKTVRSEVKYADKSRIDFLLSQSGLSDVYLEVKSVTLMRSTGIAEFPDSVTARGTRHLNDLAQMVQNGHRAAMLYLVQHTGAQHCIIAGDIDPNYLKACHMARAAGVEFYAWRTKLSPQCVRLDHRVQFDLPDI